MIEKLMNKTVLPGLIFTIVSSVFILGLSSAFFSDPRLTGSLYESGVDSLGSLVCAALFYGCKNQKEDGIGNFRGLIILVSASFAVNESIYYTLSVPKMSMICFFLCLLSKLIDLVIIFLFYQYIKTILKFEGDLANLTDIAVVVLGVFEALLILSNIFYPTTFFIDADGMYQTAPATLAEDIYIVVMSVLTMILIIRRRCPLNQKGAMMTFVLFPLVEYVMMGMQFGNSGQYGMILMSLVIMYCVIFNAKSKELASTQTDLLIAAKIQADALPPAAPEFVNHLDINLRGSMNTAREVGGDFFDYFPIDDNRICFLIADVSGKGTPAALFMMTAKTMIKDYALTRETTSEIFTDVNARLCENNEEGMFATAWIGIIDTRTMILQYTNAGHNYPILMRKGEPCEEMKNVHGLFLAGLEFTVYRHSEIRLNQGDRLLLFTDGVTEAHDEANGLYGPERLQKMVDRTRDCPGEDVLKLILDDVGEFAAGTPQFDDITMIVLTITPHAGCRREHMGV